MRRMRWLAVVAVLALTAPMNAVALAAPDTAGSVDPDTLIPPPPDGADCRAMGNQIICHTGVVEPERVNEPFLDLPCGTVYESSTDVRRGIRWYDAASRTIVRRFVSFDLEGTWSLSTTGGGPKATITGRSIMLDVVFPDPSDPDTWPHLFHGAGFTVRAPGFGVIARVTRSGGYEPDEYDHGVGGTIQNPRVASELCTALGA